MAFPQSLLQETTVPSPPPGKDEEEWIIYIAELFQFTSQLSPF